MQFFTKTDHAEYESTGQCIMEHLTREDSQPSVAEQSQAVVDEFLECLGLVDTVKTVFRPHDGRACQDTAITDTVSRVLFTAKTAAKEMDFRADLHAGTLDESILNQSNQQPGGGFIATTLDSINGLVEKVNSAASTYQECSEQVASRYRAVTDPTKLVFIQKDLSDRGQWIFRCHERSEGLETSHWNQDVTGKLKMPEISKLPDGTVQEIQKLANLTKKAMELAPKIARVTGYTLDAVSILRTVYREGWRGLLPAVLDIALSRLFSQHCTFVSLGSHYGAAIGTAICPGVGTLVGTIVGGLVGTVGSSVANIIFKKIVKALLKLLWKLLASLARHVITAATRLKDMLHRCAGWVLDVGASVGSYFLRAVGYCSD